ncbi:MAG: ABC transporter permease subunit [Nocardioidaceae bacterium]
MRRGLLGVMLAGLLLPLAPLLIWAVSGNWRYPDVLPSEVTTRGLTLLSDPGTPALHALVTSTVIGATVAVLACLIGFPAGRALGLYRFRGRRAVRFLLLAPVIVPGLAVALGLQVFFVRLGLSDTVLGVVLVQLMPTVPYAAIVFGAAFANLDVDYERQGRALGAGPARTLLFVTVPLMRPAIIVAALLTFLISWSEYVMTLLVGGGQVKTLPILLFAAIGSSDTTAAAALALLVVLPPLLLLAAAAPALSNRSAAVVGVSRL